MIEGYPVKPLSGGSPLNGLYHQLASSSSWACEAKLDGVRAYWDGTELWSRTGNRLPRVDDLKALLPDLEQGYGFDGELVKGTYWIFDFKAPLRSGMSDMGYFDRRQVLTRMFTPDPQRDSAIPVDLRLPAWRLREPVVAERVRLMPQVTWDDVERLDLEGVVFKRVTSKYTLAHRPGTKNADWIKFRKEDKA